MARIFEANQGKSSAAATTPAPRAPVAAEPRPDSAVSTPEVPFIEVGGARLEGSPDVLKANVNPPVPLLSLRTSEPPKPEIDFEGVPDAPTGEVAPEIVAYHEPEHPVSRQYQSLLDRLLAQLPQGKSAAVMLSGAAEHVGTTTALLNLAVTLAARNTPVVVVDGCLARPVIAARLGIPPVPGLSEVCAGEVRLAQALHGTRQTNLWALTAGEGACRPALALRSFPGIIEHLRRRFDWVLVDSPAWRESPDRSALAAACDALFLVAPRGTYDQAEFTKMLRRLPRQGVRLAGCIVTHRRAA